MNAVYRDMEGDDIPDTRVFVSGLPANFTSNQLRAHFAGRYQITDAVVVPGRRIGFVGFRNYTLAKSAIKYFDKTYIRMSKISVEIAKPIERTSTSSGVSRSKHSKEGSPASSLSANPAPHGGLTVPVSRSSNDAAFQSYVPVQRPNDRKRKLDKELDDEHPKAILAGNAAPAATKSENDLSKPVAEGVADLESRARGHKDQKEDVSTDSKVASKRKKTKSNIAGTQVEDDVVQQKNDLEIQDKKDKKKKRIRDGSTTNMKNHNDHVHNHRISQREERKWSNSRSQVDDDTKGGVEPIDEDTSESLGQSADQNNQQRRNPEDTSDSHWLRAKTSRLLDLTDEYPQSVASAFLKSDEEAQETTADEGAEEMGLLGDSSTEPSMTTTNSSCTSGRLFVRNLPYAAGESDITALFSQYGQLDEVHLLRDKAGSNKGIAYIQFSSNDVARHVLKELDGKSFQGRLLHILEAAEKKTRKLDDYQMSKLPLKVQKALKRKREAGGSSFSWNSMYMNPNAVLSSVADRLGVAKAELIDVSSSDAAVKQAHAETHVIQETKAFLASNGVNLDAFRQNEKDERTLLVKNLQFGTTTDDLKSLFAPYGEIVKLLLAPSGTHAIVQYAEPGEGVQALRRLAYRNLKGSVLYLEKAPKDVFDKNCQPLLNRTFGRDTSARQEDPSSRHVEGHSSCTLFVRNLNFTTTNSTLTDAFRPLSGFLSARIKTKTHPRRPQEILSMGFGFVEFSSSQQAQAALAAMNGSRLDNHELLVQVSHKATDAAEDRRTKDTLRKAQAHRTKIIIKNLPFEATKKDVRALLSAYGQLRSVKVPQKFDRSTRGFSFADFVTAKEAENVIEALKDTHLLGRRLVLEFADEESIDPEDEIRAIESKVGRQTEIIQVNKMTGSARRKFNVAAQDDPR